jgi:probable phosphoglycerate mutase
MSIQIHETIDSVTVRTELILARHGQGACNAQGVIGGDRGCTGLSPWGAEQSHRIAHRLARMHAARPFDVLFSTPRLRVRQSAEIIGEHIALPVTVIHELRGQDFGAADGQLWRDVTAGFGGPPTHDPDRPIAPGAEPWNRYARRVVCALIGLLTRHEGERLLLVAHGKTIALACALLQGSPEPAGAVAISAGQAGDHGALTHWQCLAGRSGLGTWTMVRHNDQAHLVGASPAIEPDGVRAVSLAEGS